jgi:anti-sigma factor RsiW
VRARLPRALDGALDPLAAALDRGHLEACPGCRAERERWLGLLDDVRRASRAPATEADRVIAAVLAQTAGGRPRESRPRTGLVAAAAALLLVLGGLAGGLAPSSPGPARGVTAALADLPGWSSFTDGWGRLARRLP